MTALLDGNVLIALVVVDHVHHASAETWWNGRTDRSFATAPTTQGTLLRFLLREGITAEDAAWLLDAFTAVPEHTFWPDDFAYDAKVVRGVIGHRQVTDAYLAAHARARGGSVATFDAGLFASHRDVAELVPTDG